MGIHFVGGAPHDVSPSAVSLPSWNAGGIVLVGVSDATIVLLFKIVFREVGIAAAPQPKLLDKLFALFVGIEL